MSDPRDPLLDRTGSVVLTDDQVDLVANWPIAFRLGLPPDSTIVVAGAYKGRLMKLLDDVYRPRLLVGYEPQLWTRDAAKELLGWPDPERMVLSSNTTDDGRRAELHPYAIGIEEGEYLMGEWGTDACTFVTPTHRASGSGRMVLATKALGDVAWESPSKQIDLFVVNMEGYEFDLIPHLLRGGWAPVIQRWAVQWHLDIAALEDQQTVRAMNTARANQIRFSLMQTHREELDVFPAWTYHVTRHLPALELFDVQTLWRAQREGR